jgi:DNA-binding transcriptional LysR family regulator
MDRIDALRVFVRVAELGSFRSAAQEMGLPRATVSAGLARLEAELGMRLLHRTTRRVGLTTDGAVMMERARALVEGYAQLSSDLGDTSLALTGRVVVDAPSRIARRILLPALPALLAQHPALEIDLGANDQVLDLVLERVDCVVRAGALNNSSLVALPVGAMQMVRCASPAYLSSHPRLRRPQDLELRAAAHCAVGYTPQRRDAAASMTETLRLSKARGKPTTVVLPAKVTVHNAEAYVAAAVAGLGLIEVPRFDVQELLDQGDLVEVLPDAPPTALPLNVLLPHRRQLPARVRGVASWLRELLRPLCELPSARLG